MVTSLEVLCRQVGNNHLRGFGKNTRPMKDLLGTTTHDPYGQDAMCLSSSVYAC